MQNKQGTTFTATVTEQDWDKGLRAWRFPALKIPGARLESVFVSGVLVDTSSYEVNYDLNIVRWGDAKEHPRQAVFLIRLTKELSTEELTLRWKKLAVILPFAASVLVALITVLFSHYLGDNSKTAILLPDCSEKVKIIIPNANEQVFIPVTVQGTYKDLPPGHKIYVTVNPMEVSRFYPQPNAVKQQPDNTWNTDISVGVLKDTGAIFLIQAVLADEQAQKELDLYINRVKETNDSPGLINLPKGTSLCSSVRVQRK